MEIITTLPRYSDGEVNRALVKEIQNGFQLEREQEKEREIKASEDAKKLVDHKPIKGLGRAIATMPERDYYRLIQKYGFNEVMSKDFMRYFQREFPTLSPNKMKS